MDIQPAIPEDASHSRRAPQRQGTSLSDYVLRQVIQAARTPTPEELDERIRSRGAAGVSTKDILAARDAGRQG
ncbi:MAG: hypothetical protein R2736_22970 [Solirubrobacterales bacterium]